MLPPCTNLVRVCRDSGMSRADIESLVRVLEAGRAAEGLPRALPTAPSRISGVTTMLERARTLLATLR